MSDDGQLDTATLQQYELQAPKPMLFPKTRSGSSTPICQNLPEPKPLKPDVRHTARGLVQDQDLSSRASAMPCKASCHVGTTMNQVSQLPTTANRADEDSCSHMPPWKTLKNHECSNTNSHMPVKTPIVTCGITCHLFYPFGMLQVVLAWFRHIYSQLYTPM